MLFRSVVGVVFPVDWFLYVGVAICLTIWAKAVLATFGLQEMSYAQHICAAYDVGGFIISYNAIGLLARWLLYLMTK